MPDGRRVGSTPTSATNQNQNSKVMKKVIKLSASKKFMLSLLFTKRGVSNRLKTSR
jgi:hypothetical protein